MRHPTHEQPLFTMKEVQKPKNKLSTIVRQLDCDRRTKSHVLARFYERRLLTDRERLDRPTSLTVEQ